ncbi:MAG: hypothetical protein COB02_11440 [Candidatus Cloacimonadota bacterium]|nr:MAG: hypothetical protein COB02_11440 [Candidatus Cloacimonadota bacterium]
MKSSSVLHLICQDIFFALSIKDLVEVLDKVELNPIFNTLESIKGVFYYRGKIVPLIDLSLKLFNKRETSKLARIVVVNQNGFYTGLYVDKIKMVLDYQKLIDSNITKYTKKKFQLNQNDYHLLDIEKLINDFIID